MSWVLFGCESLNDELLEILEILNGIWGDMVHPNLHMYLIEQWILKFGPMQMLKIGQCDGGFGVIFPNLYAYSIRWKLKDLTLETNKCRLHHFSMLLSFPI